MEIVITLAVLMVWTLVALDATFDVDPTKRGKMKEKLAMHWRQVEADDEEKKAVETHQRMRVEMKKASKKQS